MPKRVKTVICEGCGVGWKDPRPEYESEDVMMAGGKWWCVNREHCNFRKTTNRLNTFAQKFMPH